MSKVTDIVEDLRNIENLTGSAQEQLVSVVSIKTVNGESILGSVDLGVSTMLSTCSAIESATEAGNYFNWL